MSQSFDKSLKERLQSFEATPPSGIEGKVFANVKSVNPYKVWIGRVAIVIAMLFSAALVYWWADEAGNKVTHQESEEVVLEKSLATPSSEKNLKEDNRLAEELLPNDISTHSTGKENATLSPNQTNLISGNTSDPSRTPDLKNDPLFSINKSINTASENVSDLNSLLARSGNSWAVFTTLPEPFFIDYQQEIVPPKEKPTRTKLFAELGTFMLYNHYVPNGDDQLIINEVSGSNTFSLSRLGFYGEAGIAYQLSEKVTTRLSGTVNYYRWAIDLDVRGITPAAIIPSENNILNPVFEATRIGVQHRSLALGAKAQTIFNIFPSKLNSLMAGLEYQHMLNPNFDFTYEGNVYTIQYPHQLLLDIGFQKIFLQHQQFDFWVKPNFRYSLFNKATRTSGAMDINPYSAGLAIGIQLK